MHDQEHLVPQGDVELRADRLDLMAQALGCKDDTELAALMGVAERTIRRARRQGIIGEKLMAQTVATAKRHAELLSRHGLGATLDEFYIVHDRAA